MTDLYLKFDTEQQAKDALYDAEGAPLYQMAIDVVGTIYKPTGVMLQGADGEYPEMAALPGWHVNTRGEAPEALMPYSVNPEPSTPYRTWL